MSIEFKAQDFPGVVQLVANTEGWGEEDIFFSYNPDYKGGDPKRKGIAADDPLKKAWLTTQNQRPDDFNGPKVSLEGLAAVQNKLKLETRATDYFTLWGIPKT